MRKKQIRTMAGAILILALVLAGAAWGFGHRERGPAMAPLTCTFLKVGRADAIVMMTEGHTLVLDTGEEDDGQELTDFLTEKGVREVDVLIITHFDKDHVGGADTLLEALPVREALLPAYEGAGTEYADFMTALDRTGTAARRVTEPLDLALGEARIRVTPPASYSGAEAFADYDNNLSLLVRVLHGDKVLLFTGDIEKDRIREALADGSAGACDFLKVPHHGVYNTALEDLFRAADAEYAVVCDSDKNPADRKALELLKARGTAGLETRYGKITLVSDGRSLELRQKVRH